MDPASTRSKLLHAAAQVFLTHGFTAASMDMVRQQAGVSNGSLYHHFPTKDKLVDALYAYTLRDFHAALLTAIPARASAQAGVKGLIRAYIQWVVTHPERAQLLHELRRSGDMTDASSERNIVNAEAFGALAAWMQARVDAGEMRAMPFTVWMALVFSPAMSLTQHWVAQDKPAVPPKVRAALAHGAWMAVAVDAPRRCTNFTRCLMPKPNPELTPPHRAKKRGLIFRALAWPPMPGAFRTTPRRACCSCQAMCSTP